MKPRPSINVLLAFLLCALPAISPPPASALSAFIKQGQTGQTGTPVPLILVDSATGQTGQAGLASSATVTVEKPGTTSYVAATGTFVDAGGGTYKYFPNAAETATPGILLVRVTATGAVQSDTAVQVVGFDPASDLGAAALSGLATGQTNLANGQASIIGNQTTLLTQTSSATRQADMAAGLTAQGFTVIRAGKLDFLDVSTSSRMATFTYTAPTAFPTDYARNNVAPSWYTAVDLSGVMSRLGTPAGADLAHDIATVKAGTDANGTVIAGLPAAILLTPSNKLATTATGAVRTTNSLGKYTYNADTKALQEINDDGTPLGSPLAITVVNGVITSRQ